jgi:hypothetical protein
MIATGTDGPDLDATAELAVTVDVALGALADLGTYPHWLGIVGRAEPVSAHPDDPEGAAAWSVDLIGKVGPFTRTKTVRMVRTALDPDGGTVRFERQEHDGRHHNPWILTGEATTAGDATRTRTRIHVHLHYGGGRSLPGADLLLRNEVRNAGARLDAHLASRRRRPT